MEKLQGNGPQLRAQKLLILVAATENDAETKVLMLHKVQRRKIHTYRPFG